MAREGTLDAEREVRRYTQRRVTQGRSFYAGIRLVDRGPRVLIPLGVAPMLAIGGGVGNGGTFTAQSR